MARTLFIIFTAAFISNFVWEEWHSRFYLLYQGGEITHLILLRAALFDAAAIALFSFPFLRCEPLRRRRWLLAAALVVFAVVLEIWALQTGRWAYAAAMPVIPLVHVGLTPAIQLGLLGYLSLWIAETVERHRAARRDAVFYKNRALQ